MSDLERLVAEVEAGRVRRKTPVHLYTLTYEDGETYPPGRDKRQTQEAYNEMLRISLGSFVRHMGPGVEHRVFAARTRCYEETVSLRWEAIKRVVQDEGRVCLYTDADTVCVREVGPEFWSLVGPEVPIRGFGNFGRTMLGHPDWVEFLGSVFVFTPWIPREVWDVGDDLLLEPPQRPELWEENGWVKARTWARDQRTWNVMVWRACKRRWWEDEKEIHQEYNFMALKDSIDDLPEARIVHATASRGELPDVLSRMRRIEERSR